MGHRILPKLETICSGGGSSTISLLAWLVLNLGAELWPLTLCVCLKSQAVVVAVAVETEAESTNTQAADAAAVQQALRHGIARVLAFRSCLLSLGITSINVWLRSCQYIRARRLRR